MDKKTLKIARAAIAISIFTLLFSGIDVYFTHFHGAGVDLRIEHLDTESVLLYENCFIQD